MPSLTRASAMKRKKGEQLTRKKREVKRRRPTSRAEEEGEDDDFFGGEEHVASSEDEGVDVKKNRSRDVEEEQQRADVEGLVEETAEEKRLRIAKAYLDRLKGAAASAESESGGEEGGEDDEEGRRRRRGEEDDDASEGEDAVAAKLKEETAEATGRLLRKIAANVRLGVAAGLAEDEQKGKRVGRRHRQSVTSVALSTDDRTGFSASKDGAIYQWDVETNRCVEYPAPNTSKDTRKQSRHLLSLAVSSDGHYLVAGGLDRRVHVWDTRTLKYVRAFAGHRGAVTCLSFRAGTNQLFSGSNDRAVKIWNVDDMAYVDSLFGHQSDVVSLDSLRRERILTCSRDKTCRIWKVPEETQLVFRGHQTTTSIDSCAFISASEFVSGGDDGSVALWSLLRKKPVFIVKNAHGGGGVDDDHQAKNLAGEGKAQRRAHSANGDAGSNLDGGNQTASGGDGQGSAVMNEDGSAGGIHSSRVDRNGHLNTKESDSMKRPVASNASAGLGFRVGVEGWVGAIAACRGSDLLASGAGDGVVRVWGHDAEKQQLWTVGKLPSVGFVNSLAFAKSGRFLLAGMGQEPRLGRWGKNKQARNHVVMYKIHLES